MPIKDFKNSLKLRSMDSMRIIIFCGYHITSARMVNIIHSLYFLYIIRADSKYYPFYDYPSLLDG